MIEPGGPPPSDSTVLARHYRTGQPVRILMSRGVIRDISPADAASPEDLRWVAPCLFDVQVNGFAGVDFQQDTLQQSDLERAAAALSQHGCFRFFPTLITDGWPRMIERLSRLVAMSRNSPLLASAIVGWHIEGPFLSDRPGYAGAHNAEYMRDPLPTHLEELRRITGIEPVLFTIAPERAGALESIRHATSLGIRVSLGHTNASSEQLANAIDAGATCFTHLGNGCPAELPRHDNIIWRVLDAEKLTASVIPDGVHLPAAVLRCFAKVLGSRMFFTTDSMAAAGSAPGEYTIGSVRARVDASGVVRKSGTPYLAGSSLTPIEGVIRAAQMLSWPWQRAWELFSEAPANAAGIAHGLAAGQSASAVLLFSNWRGPWQRLDASGPIL